MRAGDDRPVPALRRHRARQGRAKTGCRATSSARCSCTSAWRIFADNPSSAPAGRRAPRTASTGRTSRRAPRVPGTPALAFPSPEHPWGVQNAYVQALADLGVVGLLAFLSLLVSAAVFLVRPALRAPPAVAVSALVAVVWLVLVDGTCSAPSASSPVVRSTRCPGSRSASASSPPEERARPCPVRRHQGEAWPGEGHRNPEELGHVPDARARSRAGSRQEAPRAGTDSTASGCSTSAAASSRTFPYFAPNADAYVGVDIDVENPVADLIRRRRGRCRSRTRPSTSSSARRCSSTPTTRPGGDASCTA